MNMSLEYVAKMLDATALRHRVLANNLANVNTPGFVRKDVQFRQQMAEALASGDVSRVRAVQPEVHEDTGAPARPDGNNVSTQRELGEMSENGLLYQLLTRSVSGKFAGLHKAIRGRP